jgi:hypothetical protein
MANSEHLSVLASGVSDWNRWRSENPGIYPDLSDISLSDRRLNGIDFSRCNLIGSHMNRTQLLHANLHRANLSNASVQNADLLAANCDSLFA